MRISAVAVLLLIFLTQIISSNTACARSIDEHIYLMPSGTVDAKVVESVKGRLSGLLPMATKVDIDPAKAVPQSSYDQSRKQCNAEIFLKEMADNVSIVAINEREIVITDADLFTPKQDFVFGIADAKKGVCVVSIARLKNEFYGGKPDAKLLANRALKEVLYEFGKSRSLADCDIAKCVMHHSASVADVDKKGDGFCRDCSRALANCYKSPWVAQGLLNDVIGKPAAKK